MSKKPLKKSDIYPEGLEPKEEAFYAECDIGIYGIYETIQDEIMEEEFQAVDDRINAAIVEETNRLRDALLVLITFYYLRGIRKAENQLDQPTLYTTEDIRNIDEILREAHATIVNIYEEFKSGIFAGLSSATRTLDLKQAKKSINRALDRARKVSATESMKARNRAMVTTYIKRGAIYYIYWVAIKDERLCPSCSQMMDKIYPLQNWDFIPDHPYCRCFWKPIRKLEEML
jgi:SPP1 gp7 family putative phage head morphogenesis protein